MSSLKPYQMLIDGQWVDAEDGNTFESINPANGQPWATIPSATENDVDRAVRAAHRAFTEGPWSRTTPATNDGPSASATIASHLSPCDRTCRREPRC